MRVTHGLTQSWTVHIRSTSFLAFRQRMHRQKSEPNLFDPIPTCMDAIFTLPYSEYAAANILADAFKPSQGYSVFVPASRTEKGVDLLLTKRDSERIRTLTFQVKASRTYPGSPAIRKVKNRRFAYYTWFNCFDVSPQADYFILFGLYAPEQSTSKRVAKSWWQSMCLVFSNRQMSEFMANIKTKGGKPDRMFGFGFDTPKEVLLTRGSQSGTHTDYSSHLFASQLEGVKFALASS